MGDKCKLLPHLGNQLAFSVDTESDASYDAVNAFFINQLSAFPPLERRFPYGHRAKE